MLTSKKNSVFFHEFNGFFVPLTQVQVDENKKLEQELEKSITDSKLKRNFIISLVKSSDKLEKVLKMEQIRNYLTPKDVCLIAAAEESCCNIIIDSEIYEDDKQTWDKIQRLKDTFQQMDYMHCPK